MPRWFYLLLWCCLTWFLPVEASPLRVVVNDAPPYRIVKPPLYRGYYIELLLAAAKLANLELEFIDVPLKRAFQMLARGEADLMLGPNRTPEREQFLYFLTEVPFPAEDKVFMVAHPDRMIRSLFDLEGKRIDVLAGAVYHPDIDHASQLKKHELKSYSQGLQRVAINRSDVVIIPEAQADWLTKELGLSLIKSSFRLRGNPSYMAWSKATYDPQLAQRLSQGMQQVLASEQGRAIHARYFR